MLTPAQIEETLILLRKALVLATYKYVEAKKWGFVDEINCHYKALNEFKNKIFLLQNIDSCPDVELLLCNISKISIEYMNDCSNSYSQLELTNLINTLITGDLKDILDHLGPCLFDDTSNGVNPVGETLCERLQVYTDNIGDLAGDLAELQTDVAALEAETLTSTDKSIKITTVGSNTDLSTSIMPLATVVGGIDPNPSIEVYVPFPNTTQGVIELGVSVTVTNWTNIALSVNASASLLGNPRARKHWDGLVEFDRRIICNSVPTNTTSILLGVVPSGMAPSTTKEIDCAVAVFNNVTNVSTMVSGLLSIFPSGNIGFAVVDDYYDTNRTNLDPEYTLYLDKVKYYIS